MSVPDLEQNGTPVGPLQTGSSEAPDGSRATSQAHDASGDPARALGAGDPAEGDAAEQIARRVHAAMSGRANGGEDRTGDDRRDVAATSGPGAALDESAVLPPVEPPSARFIMQLFVVPALIVLAIVGVWLLFGKLTAQQEDWQTIVSRLQSTNPDVRWRAAMALAQLLANEPRQKEEGVAGDVARLAENRQAAVALAELTREKLQKLSSGVDEDRLQQIVFLTRALALFSSTDVTLPVLMEAIEPGRPEVVRQSGLAALAILLDRSRTRKVPVHDDRLTELVIDASDDPSPSVRQLAAFVLGLLEGEKARDRLQELLHVGDRLVRLNAACALARNGSPEGFAELRNVLEDELSGGDEGNDRRLTEQQYAQQIALGNVFQAIQDLADRFSPDQRSELESVLQKIADTHRDVYVQMQARKALGELRRSQRNATP